MSEINERGVEPAVEPARSRLLAAGAQDQSGRLGRGRGQSWGLGAAGLQSALFKRGLRPPSGEWMLLEALGGQPRSSGVGEVKPGDKSAPETAGQGRAVALKNQQCPEGN